MSLRPIQSFTLVYAPESHALATHVTSCVAPLLKARRIELLKPPPGATERERFAVVARAKAICVVVDSHLLADPFCVRLLDTVIARRRAGEARTMAVRGGACFSTSILDDLVITPQQGYWHTSEAHRDEVIQCIHNSLAVPLAPHVAYECAEDALAADRSEEDAWEYRAGYGESLRAQDPPLRNGHFLKGAQIQLRRCLTQGDVRAFLAHDYRRSTDVMVHVLADEMDQESRAARHLDKLARFRHPVLFSLLEPPWREQGMTFFTTEKIDGVSLQEAVFSGALGGQHGRASLFEIGMMMTDLHARDCWHGQLDPLHVRLCTSPNGNTARLRVALPVLHGCSRWLSEAQSVDVMQRRDAAAFAKTLLFCMLGSTLPEPLTREWLDGALAAQEAPLPLKQSIFEAIFGGARNIS